jgi:hypothetical protein
MVSVRTVRVSGVDYIQVVDYKPSSGQTRVDVVKSFGRYSLENELKAQQFAADYDRLKDLARKQASQSTNQEERQDFLSSALAVFGIVLGAAAIIALLNEIFRD